MEMAEVPSNWNDNDPLPESNSDAWKLLSKEKSQLVTGCTQTIFSSRPSSFVGSAFKFKFLVKLNQDAMPIWRYRHCGDVYHIVVRQVRDVALTVTWVTERHRNPIQFPDRNGVRVTYRYMSGAVASTKWFPMSMVLRGNHVFLESHLIPSGNVKGRALESFVGFRIGHPDVIC